MMASPAISVVMPVRRAATTVAASLDSLLPQCEAAGAEVIAAVCEDDPTLDVLARISHPCLRVLRLPGPCGVPQLRRDAVFAARAPWVAITEDHCAFASGWLDGLRRSLGRPGRQVRGGPVSNGCHTLGGWALYFSRYTAFMPPVAEGPVASLPGNSACYPRAALLDHLDVWRGGFWETEVNAALLQDRYTLWISPALEVRQHQLRGPLEYTLLRFRHGWLFAVRHGRALPARLALLLRTPLVPAVLYARALRRVLASRARYLQFLAATPLLLLYYSAWAAGEAAGFLLGGAGRPLETD